MKLRTLNKPCRNAADVQVQDVTGTLACKQGRELIRNNLQATLKQQAEERQGGGGQDLPGQVTPITDAGAAG